VITIITPVYNGVNFIEACLKVVIDQHCPEAEHIVVDGGSTDGTVEIIKRYADQYSHLHWISEKDRGQSDAMNKGLALAHGEIIGFLNVDDYYEPDVLDRVAKIFSTLPEPSLLVGNCNVWGDADKLLYVNRPGNLKFTDLLMGPGLNPFPINPSAYFYHATLHDRIGSYDIDEHYTLDLDFLLRAVQVAHVHYVAETWGNYRRVAGTKTVESWRRGEATQAVKRVIKKYRYSLSPWRRCLSVVGYELFNLPPMVTLVYFARHSQELPWRLKARVQRI
jgi:glycosyltransferase involved in cell wall biosynthesis